MADHTIRDIRNIALISHAGSGKTTLAEAIAHNAGVTSRFGKVEDGTTVSDYSEDEKERKVSINSSVLSFDYKGKHINMIDTPGYADFIGEALACLTAVDSAILLVVAPVARVNITTVNEAANATVTPGTDVVMCLSCHGAHATAYADILRWDYTGMVTGGSSNTTGCFVCHTTKDT
ncbi:MAG: hypothetical protein KKD12_07595 [Proteobacteria bacterium]|nr:hypothetical protein [Pseudomonadota bacterium]